MSKPSVALQLYTVRDFAAKDVPGTLKEVKAMGYDYVELAGTYDLETAVYRKLLDDAGLQAVSAHLGLRDFESGAAAKYSALGCKIVNISSLQDDELPGGANFEATKAALIKAAAQCKEHGMALGYHNHAWEFETLPCGTFILDALFDATSPDVLVTQIDTGWVTAAGQDPAAYIKKHAGRCPTVHLKDIIDVNGNFEDRPVGKGKQDMAAVTKAAAESGAWLMVVELDAAVGMTSLEAAKESREYLKSLGY